MEYGLKPRNVNDQKQTIYIVTATNNTYAEHLAVMIRSLLENKVSNNPIEIYVISSDISEQNKTLLTKTAGKFMVKIKFLKIASAVYEEFMTLVSVGDRQKYLTKETYYRISIPDLLDETIEKALYLDSDMIIKNDITELWNTNIDNYLAAAVEDHWAKKSRNSDLSIPKESKYFNAGVLLINVQKWREEKIKNKIMEFIKTNAASIKFYSQDPLNAVLYDKWHQLDVKWNFQTEYLKYSQFKHIKPAIIHYTGGKKPWITDHPLGEEYYKYKKNVSFDNE